MATKQSTLLTNRASITNAGTPNNVANERGEVRSVNGTVALATGDLDANDIVMLAGVPTGATILQLWIANDDLDGATSALMDVGIYRNADDTAENGDEDVYADGDDQLQAASSFVDHAFTTRGIEKTGQKVWQDAGDSVDPNGEYFIGVKIATAPGTAQAGDLSFIIVYADS